MKPSLASPKRMKLLFADDEKFLQDLMSRELPLLGHQVTVCPDGLTAAAALEKNSYDCLLVDIDMPGMNGIEVIARAKELDPDAEAVVLTGKGTRDYAVAALRHGAFDFLDKPYKLTDIESVLARVADKRELTKHLRALRHRLEKLEGGAKLVGQSLSMQKVQRLITKVAPTDSTVLVLGETGTGKELVARAVHDQSLRGEKPFVAVNCGALPESLIESELFGHRKGAFTGADEHRVGLFEVADGGTIFLDEIGELPKAMQAKLLRVLESGEIRRVGDNDSKTVDVRVVCATHRNLEEMVGSGEFREDLMFRINTFEIPLPALRERRDDIPILCRHLLRRFRAHLKDQDEMFTRDAVALLQEHIWPGNVRELANVIEHAAILNDAIPIGVEDFPSNFSHRALSGPKLKIFHPMTLREIEWEAVQQALDRHSGNKPKAAEELGVSLKTLYNKLNQSAA